MKLARRTVAILLEEAGHPFVLVYGKHDTGARNLDRLCRALAEDRPELAKLAPEDRLNWLLKQGNAIIHSDGSKTTVYCATTKLPQTTEEIANDIRSHFGELAKADEKTLVDFRPDFSGVGVQQLHVSKLFDLRALAADTSFEPDDEVAQGDTVGLTDALERKIGIEKFAWQVNNKWPVRTAAELAKAYSSSRFLNRSVSVKDIQALADRFGIRLTPPHDAHYTEAQRATLAKLSAEQRTATKEEMEILK